MKVAPDQIWELLVPIGHVKKGTRFIVETVPEKGVVRECSLIPYASPYAPRDVPLLTMRIYLDSRPDLDKWKFVGLYRGMKVEPGQIWELQIDLRNADSGDQFLTGAIELDINGYPSCMLHSQTSGLALLKMRLDAMGSPSFPEKWKFIRGNAPPKEGRKDPEPKSSTIPKVIDHDEVVLIQEALRDCPSTISKRGLQTTLLWWREMKVTFTKAKIVDLVAALEQYERGK